MQLACFILYNDFLGKSIRISSLNRIRLLDTANKTPTLTNIMRKGLLYLINSLKIKRKYEYND